MDFLFDLPLVLTGPILIGVLVVASLAALGWFRRHELPRLRFGDGDVEFGAAMLASIMVFYGLATALTAVQVWEGYEKVREINEQEASSLAAFYRNASQYPEPLRSVLRERVRTYTQQVIHDSWPLQRKGRIPREGVRFMDDLQAMLVRFEPTTEAQKVLAFETLASFDRMMEARRMRLGSVGRKLPGILWLVILLGAFVSLVSAFYFPVHEARLHRVQVGLLAGFIGLVIFMIFALDRPYRGDLGLRPHPYELLYEQLMTE